MAKKNTAGKIEDALCSVSRVYMGVPYSLQPKEQELRIFIPTHMGCVKNGPSGPTFWWTRIFHPTHQQRLLPIFAKKTHINFQTSPLLCPKTHQNPHGTSTFSLRLASPIASASTAAASAAAVALRSAARCADTTPSPGRCGSEPDRRRSGRAPGVHHGPMVTMDLDETLRIWGKFGGFQWVDVDFHGKFGRLNWFNELKCWFLLGTWWKHQEKGWFLTGFWQDDFVDFHLNVMGFCW